MHFYSRLSLYGGATLQKIPITDVVCDLFCYRYYIVYKLGLAIALYHGIMALSLLGVKSHSDDRSVIQDAFWPVKVIAMAAVIVGCVWLPRSFLDMIYYPMLISTLLFAALQALIMVDATYAITGACLDRGGVFMGILMVASALLFGLIVAGTVGMYLTFSTIRERSLVIGSAIVTLILGVLSVLPFVRKGNERSGLFQASVIGTLNLAIISSAIIFAPSNQVVAHSDRFLSTLTFITRLLSGVFCVASILAVTFLGGGKKDLESEDHEYNYSLFHLLFMLGAMYMVAIITGWQKTFVDGRSLSFYEGEYVFYAKICAAVVIDLIYSWTLFGPVLLPDRQFDF